MVSRRFRPLAALLAVFLLGELPKPAGAADRGAQGGTAALTKGAHGEPMLDVTIAGRQVRVIVDTGSTHTSVSDALAATLGAPLVARSSVATVAGSTTYPIARIDRLIVAGIAVEGVLATVLPRRALDPSGDAEAVLGQDVLGLGIYTLDFAAGRFSWTHEAQRATGLDLELVNGRFVARMPQAAGLLRLVPDSGSEALVLFGSDHHLDLQSGAAADAWVETVSGRRRAQLVTVSRLSIGAAAIFGVRAAILPGDNADVDGLLPLMLFARVTIDGPSRRMFVEP